MNNAVLARPRHRGAAGEFFRDGAPDLDHKHAALVIDLGGSLQYVACWGCPMRGWALAGVPISRDLAYRCLPGLWKTKRPRLEAA